MALITKTKFLISQFYPRISQQLRQQGSRNFRSQRQTQQNESLVQKSRRKLPLAISILTGTALLAYDGVVNDFVYLGSSTRFLRSLKAAAYISADYFWLFSTHDETEDGYAKLLKAVHQRSANHLIDTCLSNGGLYIKVGQGVAAINHILPVEYTRTLSRLQNECMTGEVLDVRQIFASDFESLPEDVFEDFDYKPVAAASLAQVFKATGKNGEILAVKVQYNDLQKRFKSDLGTIIFLQDIIEIFFKDYNFGWIIRDVRKNLEQELDFVNEGKNSERAARDLKKFKHVHIPKVYWDLTKTRVLTTEWIDGYKIDDFDWMKKENVSLYEVDVKLFNLFSEQIFNTGFVHADPHPGNVFLRKGKSGEVELVLLDHGLYEWIPDNVRLTLCKFWEATVMKDQKAMKENAANLHITNYKQFAEILFQQPIELRIEKIKTKLTQEDIDYMQYIAKNHFSYIMQALKDMPRNMLFVVRNLNTIRAIGREHGDPVDRPKLMARYAQRCIYKNENRFTGTIKWFFRRIRFEYCLLKTNLQIFVLSLYFDILHKLGRSPQGSSVLKFQPS